MGEGWVAGGINGVGVESCIFIVCQVYNGFYIHIFGNNGQSMVYGCSIFCCSRCSKLCISRWAVLGTSSIVALPRRDARPLNVDALPWYGLGDVLYCAEGMMLSFSRELCLDIGLLSCPGVHPSGGLCRPQYFPGLYSCSCGLIKSLGRDQNSCGLRCFTMEGGFGRVLRGFLDGCVRQLYVRGSFHSSAVRGLKLSLGVVPERSWSSSQNETSMTLKLLLLSQFEEGWSNAV
eukprot:IDg7388t1